VFLFLACLSLGSYIWLHDIRSPNAAFFLSVPRAFELMIGAMLAADPLPPLTRRPAREIAGAAGLMVLLLFVTIPGAAFLDVGPLLACLGTAAIIRAGKDGNSRISTLLSLPPLGFIGAISYSLYLWHWPILSLAKNYLLRDLNTVETGAAICLAFAAAILSRRFIEKPALAMHWGAKHMLAAGFASAAAAAVGLILVTGKGFPNRFSDESLRLFAYRVDYSPERDRCHGSLFHDLPFAQSCRFGAEGLRDPIVVWADSFGAELAPALGEAVRSRTTLQVTSSSCPPAPGFNPAGRPDCGRHNRSVLTALLKDKQAKTVILAARYDAYGRQLWPAFEHAVAALSKGGKQVIIIGPIPEFFASAPDVAGLMAARGISPSNYQTGVNDFHTENAIPLRKLRELAARYRLTVVFPERVFCSAHACSAYDGRDVLYFDGHHLDHSGARKLAAAVKPLL
jgi:hypothetical protein